MSNNIVSDVATSTINAAEAAKKAPRNATKQQAAALATIAMGFRKAKGQPSRVMTVFASDVAAVLMDDNDKARLKAAADRAIRDAKAVIEAQLQRALELSEITRGTTGPGGIHRDDVVVEVFAADKKSAAAARNTAALQKAGLIA